MLTYSRSIATGPPSGNNVAINVFDGLSRVNHKHQEWTTRDGHLLGALCDITVRVPSGDYFETSFFGLPNSWTVRNAFRKFHFLRNAMFEKAGVEKSEVGKYGHTLRPRLLPDARWTGTLNAQFYQVFPGAILSGESWGDGSTVDSFTLRSDAVTGSIPAAEVRNKMQEELEYTKLVSAAQTIGSASVPDTDKLYDEWDLHIILGHDVTETNIDADQWSSVGMLMAYLQDRQAEIPDATAASAMVAFNPLAALATQTATSGEIVDIASQQSLETPPYDIGDDERGSGVQLVNKGHLTVYQITSQAGVALKAERTLSNVFLPSGWVTFNSSASNFEIDVEVKGIFECRDVI